MPGRSRAGRRILVVDDNIDGANSLALLLRALGHEVHVAHDGAEALEAARRLQPQVLFLDIVMPGMDGYEVARQLRADMPPAELRIYAMSGFGQDEDRQRSIEAGIDQHLVKPLEREFLDSLFGRR
jgi:CheY-like chemotaxis protein